MSALAGADAVKPYTQPPPFHGQWGEDHWLAEHLVVPGTGVFVDVGAGDGERGSNTLYFEQLGWHGLCVEPDPRNQRPLRERRRCLVETCAVAPTSGTTTFGMYTPKPSWSGLRRHGADYQQIDVTCATLDDLLRRSHIDQIDLISIDVEGTELEVWDSFDADQYRPAIVIIEYDDRDASRCRTAIRARLGRAAYHPIHQTPANLILQRTDRPWRSRM
jgi:FkbM family methyltransferase